MKFKPIGSFKIPENLATILEEEGYYEDETYKPILITIGEVQYRGEDMISYQAEFEVLDEYKEINGYDWEGIIRIYVEEKEPEIIEKIKGDSESSTCVIWTNNKSNFKKILVLMLELIENENEVQRILTRF